MKDPHTKESTAPPIVCKPILFPFFPEAWGGCFIVGMIALRGWMWELGGGEFRNSTWKEKAFSSHWVKVVVLRFRRNGQRGQCYGCDGQIQQHRMKANWQDCALDAPKVQWGEFGGCSLSKVSVLEEELRTVKLKNG